MNRRSFLASALAAAQAGRAAGANVRLGIDLFSIRNSGYTPFEYLDYSAKLGAKVVHFSEIQFIGSLEDEHLRKVRAHAERLGIEIELGMRSICPTSRLFDPKSGTVQEQLARMLRAARTAGSPIVRCFLGNSADRATPGGIDARIDDTVKVLRTMRSQVMDSGLKVAIENHSGDMQARELKRLVEESGKDFVGVCLDSGNPLWAIEDPHLTLETLHPYVLTSHIRDTALWRVPEGVAVQWVRMGDGNVNIREYVRKYVELCPGRALSMEIIVTGPRLFPVFDPKFWDAYRTTPAWEFSRFLALADKGAPRPAEPAPAKDQVAQRQRADLEVSVAFTKGLIS